MKKFFLIILLFYSFASANYARTYLVATLQHEGQFAQFYGADALTSAYNSAVDGDIITLSPGEFTISGTIKKGITLRGVGIGATDQTVITSIANFYSQDSTSVTIVEGILFKNNVSVVNSPSAMGQGTIKFIKNHFAGLYSGSSGNPSATDKAPSVKLYNNIINFMEFGGNTYPDFQFYNCYVGDPHVQRAGGISETSTTFRNCLIEWKSMYDPGSSWNPIWYSYAGLASYLNFINCIFNYTITATWDRALHSTASCINCLSLGNTSLFSSIFYNQNNKYADNITDVFLTYTSGYTYPETFGLTESAKGTYLDSDGVEIGMQGGLYPFGLKVQYPVITSFSADTQTTKDGKLNVSIEVDGK